MYVSREFVYALRFITIMLCAYTMCTNTTYTFGVEDVVLGDLESARIGGSAADGGMDFWWIDWQQGGSQGGMTGDKQNPTIWLAHLRCTDRHRVGDEFEPVLVAVDAVSP